MTESTASRPSTRSWWLAIAALAVCGPWPGWEPGAIAVASVVGLLIVLARPSGHQRWPWLAVAVALVGAIAPVGGLPNPNRLADEFGAHCGEMLSTATDVVSDERLTRLFSSTGEALDPTRPFAILDDVVGGRAGRSIYLADDRGLLLAWGGADRAFPAGLRPLGPRGWGVEWSASRAVLHLREPLMIEGRIVGSVTIADRAGLRGRSAWGMQAPRGRTLILGRGALNAVAVKPDNAPGIVVDVGSGMAGVDDRRLLFGLGWFGLVICALLAGPTVAWAAVLVGLTATALGGLSTTEQAVVMLLSGAAVGRLSRNSAPAWSRVLIIVTLLGTVAFRIFGPMDASSSWLPNHLLRPGWGGLWMVALGWAVAGWPALARGRFSLERRMLLATGLAVLGLVVDILWYPVQLSRDRSDATPQISLPRESVALEGLLPAPISACRLDDLAPVLAARWGLHRWKTPSRLTLVGGDGTEISSWGDLTPAGERQRLARMWPLDGEPGALLELDVATEPWSWLEDWSSGATLEEAWRRPVWYAVLTRSGTVAATLHPEIQDLDPATAGEAYHAGSSWTSMRVGDRGALVRVTRRGEWLVAAVAHPPAPPVWVVRTALAVLWALLGMIVALPPMVGREQFATFGGRLRLLVAGGVVIPLVILTLFLQLRLGREERRLEEVLGLHAFDAARYTIEHLGEGVVVDDQLASWLARGWGGEVVFFDRTTALAVSRPDLLSVGRLTQLPVVEAFPAYLLGRKDAVVVRRPGWVASAGGVTVGERPLLLQLYRSDPLRTGEAPDAVDWLLTGALLAALIALIATGRIEERLSISLRDLVGLAGRLVRGEPVGPVRRPRETDLAEVLDAVRSMNEEVRRRELSLRHQEELLRITLENLAPAVMVLEPGGELQFVNSSAQGLLDRHGGLVFDRVRELAGKIGDDTGVSATSQPIPGRDLTWQIGVAEVPLPDGRNGVVAVIDDITEVVRVDRLQQLNQLARIVAHEVKNPLTPIRLWIQELDEARKRDDRELDELLSEACGEIAIQVERLETTAMSFSNLVALERWQPEAVDLVDAVRTLMSGFGVLERRGISVVTEMTDPGTAVVMADRQWLQRALANLMRNSLDALGDDPGEIRLMVDSEADWAVFEIEDSGGGIAAGQLQDLFSPHFSTTAAGSGLGLALVQQVVTRCQGRVEAANGPEGLRIRIEFPSATMTS